MTEKAREGDSSRSESAEEHRPIEQPIAVALHKRRLFSGVVHLGTGVDREERVLLRARRFDQGGYWRVGAQFLTVFKKRANELRYGIVRNVSVGDEIGCNLQRGDAFLRQHRRAAELARRLRRRAP